MKYAHTILFIFACVHFAQAQTPTVPGRMTIGNLTLRINEAARRQIQEDVNMLTRHHSYYMNKVERARTYFPIIERIFQEEGIPDEIKFLVLQESELVSDAVSTSDAVGYWQMKDFTAMELGLVVNRNIDERKNIVSSTYGAALYFKKSQELFENWIYSLQSYQMGIGGAERALGEKNRGVSTLNINAKTYWYVKKYLAHVVAFRGIVEASPAESVSEYNHGAGKSLNEIARETGTTTEELRKYNTWWKHGRLPEEGTFTVIIPGEYNPPEHLLARKNLEEVESSAPQFINKADLFPMIKEDRYKDHKYIVGVNGLPAIIASSTDNAVTLAQKGEIPLSKFLNFNDLRSNNVIPGQVYYLKRKKRKAGVHYHSFKEGETLWQVSQKYGIRLNKLIAKNRITAHEQNSLKPGRILWLRFIRPADTPVAYSQIQENTAEELPEDSLIIDPVVTPDPPEEVISDEASEEEITENVELEYEPDNSTRGLRKRNHTVRKGDTYYSLSNRYGVSVVDILKWNQLKISDKLAIGQVLAIYTAKSDEETPMYTTHIVKIGETLFSISKEYQVSISDLMKWNNKTDTSLQVGEKIRILN